MSTGYYRVRFSRRTLSGKSERCAGILPADGPGDAFLAVENEGIALPGTIEVSEADTVDTMLARGKPGGIYPEGLIRRTRSLDSTLGLAADFLESLAQNDYMIDQHYLPTGKTLLAIAQRLRERKA